MPRYIAPKGETYSFLVFDSVDNAKTLFENCDGLLKLSQEMPKTELLIVLAYVNTGGSKNIIYKIYK